MQPRQLDVSRKRNSVRLNSPLTAAGFCVNVVKLVAASYLTALEGALSSSEMHLIHLAYVDQ